MNGDFRFVWGLDYFLTLPDTRGTILSDSDITDNRDNNGHYYLGYLLYHYLIKLSPWYPGELENSLIPKQI